MHFELSHIGPVDLDDPLDHYGATVVVAGTNVELDVNVRPGQPLEREALQRVEGFVVELETWHRRCAEAIRADFEAGGDAAYYVDEFLELLEDATVEALLVGAPAELPRREQMLSVLHLARVGFYPDPQLYPNQDSFAVFDFTLGKAILDHLVVVNVRGDGTFASIVVES